ncbi:hypothetical protein ACLB2K_051712 [Fragaria x ananassa]
MAVCENGPMMLKAVNCEREYKDHQLIVNLLIDSIKQVGYENVVQVVTDNAPFCLKAGALIATLNNVDVYDTCCWIQPVVEDVMFIKNFIMNYGRRLVMFGDHCNLKLFSVAPIRFAYTFIMLKRFKTIKNGSQQMVIIQNVMITKKMIIGKRVNILLPHVVKGIGSTYNFIHSLKRNKLAPQRAEDLVFVHINLRILARQSQTYNKGATHMWDIGGDDFDSLEDSNVRRLEIANLSLDEPQLEAVLFEDDEFEEENIEEDDVVRV